MKRTGITLLYVFCILPMLAQQHIDLLGTAGRTQHIKLSEIATSIRTIQLETTDDCLLVPDQMSIYYGKEYIFAFDGTDPGNYYRFTLDGKFMNRIGKSGPGPEEYQEGYHYIVDEDRNEFWIQDWRSFSFFIYTFEGKFKRKVPIEKGVFLNNRSVLNGDSIFYFNSSFYSSTDTYELLCSNIQSGKLYNSIMSSIPKDLKIRILLSRSILYRYQNRIFYKNPLSNVILRVDNNMALTPQYVLNLGKKDNTNRDDIYHPQKGLDYVDIRNFYETDTYILFYYYYKEKSYWSLCSKKDWKCRNMGTEIGFDNDLEPGGKPFISSYHNSESNTHLIGYIPDELGEDNPAIVVVELKK